MAVLDRWVASINVLPEPVIYPLDLPKSQWYPAATPEVVKSPASLDWWPSSTEYGKIINVKAGIPEEARLVWSQEYPAKKTATGIGEECMFKVVINMPDQLFPDVWQASRIASTFQSEIKKQGADILDLKIYIDTTPTWTTDYYGVALIKPAATSTAVAFPFPWAVVIPLVLVLLIVLSFTWFIIQIKEVDLGKIVAGVTIPLVAIAAVAGVIGFLMLASPGGKKSTVEGGAEIKKR